MILGIIPARGGSKRIPKKNIKLICGKPLIAWTIEAAKRSKLLDKFVISTEDEEIAAISRKFGAEVLNRPLELATDEATTTSVVQNVLKKIDADIVVLLQPTSPIRDPNLIDYCIRRFIDTGADSLATGFTFDCRNYSTCELYGIKLKDFFCDDGNIYVWKADLIRKGEKIGKKFEKVPLDKEQNMEIDDEFDFWLAEQVLKKRLRLKQ
jgi:CMP-N-acetylneuraminic acid synthetase